MTNCLIKIHVSHFVLSLVILFVIVHHETSCINWHLKKSQAELNWYLQMTMISNKGHRSKIYVSNVFDRATYCIE